MSGLTREEIAAAVERLVERGALERVEGGLRLVEGEAARAVEAEAVALVGARSAHYLMSLGAAGKPS